MMIIIAADNSDGVLYQDCRACPSLMMQTRLPPPPPPPTTHPFPRPSALLLFHPSTRPTLICYCGAD